MIKLEKFDIPKDLDLSKADKILWIGIPCSGESIPKYCFFSLLQMFNLKNIILLAQYGIGHVITSMISTFPTDVARNDFVESALKNGADHLMFFDNDQTFPIDTLPNLVKHDKDVIVGLYYGRFAPFMPIFYRWAKGENFRLFNPIYNYPQDRPFRIDMAGMGCCLVKKEVFIKLDRPYFKYQESSLEPGRFNISEDVWFFKQCFLKGIEVWATPEVKCGHLGGTIIDEEISMNFRKTYLDQLKEKDPNKYEEYTKIAEQTHAILKDEDKTKLEEVVRNDKISGDLN